MNRNVIVAIVLVVVGVIAVTSLTGPDSSSASTRGKPWETFGTGNVSYTVPPGWTKADPYTTATPDWSHQWFSKDPSHTTRIALLQSPATQEFQIFLCLGKTTELNKLIRKYAGEYDHHPLVGEIEKETLTTADGVQVRVWVARMLPGMLAGKDVTYVLGYAVLGDEAFLLNAGSLTAGYDAKAMRAVIRSLRLGK